MSSPLRCGHCRKSLIGEDRYRLHFEPVARLAGDPGDRFFCSIPCVRDWAAKKAAEAE